MKDMLNQGGDKVESFNFQQQAYMADLAMTNPNLGRDTLSGAGVTTRNTTAAEIYKDGKYKIKCSTRVPAAPGAPF